MLRDVADVYGIYIYISQNSKLYIYFKHLIETSENKTKTTWNITKKVKGKLKNPITYHIHLK
jgi:hypothetical protein